jgi:hypothetical protein
MRIKKMQGFESEANEDGLHSPSILNNITGKPLIGKQYLVLSKFVLSLTLNRSIMIAFSNLFHACYKYPQFVLENTGHPSPDGTINILVNFSELRNTVDLSHLPEEFCPFFSWLNHHYCVFLMTLNTFDLRN